GAETSHIAAPRKIKQSLDYGRSCFRMIDEEYRPADGLRSFSTPESSGGEHPEVVESRLPRRE
ncbi:MAG: hypothetical protein P4M00_14595, partial [Azospirillaceae bacterium]|nr:hypothetical protein [Azospirillaceae bacterium]